MWRCCEEVGNKKYICETRLDYLVPPWYIHDTKQLRKHSSGCMNFSYQKDSWEKEMGRRNSHWADHYLVFLEAGDLNFHMTDWITSKRVSSYLKVGSLIEMLLPSQFLWGKVCILRVIFWVFSNFAQEVVSQVCVKQSLLNIIAATLLQWASKGAVLCHWRNRNAKLPLPGFYMGI